ncbi:MAG: pentachlorophenol monooxygenase [Acidobacteria bacterium]|nr:MAG: pentachlorophenol monooxygenase [Acidobacteriota bacterium]REK11531.1 MAG: pentachlorophenol monooxygenase [Acidobacteriota bacterium]
MSDDSAPVRSPSGLDRPSEPVLIVGAGPVGMTAALLLARRGVSSILLDQADGPSAVGSRSICQQRDVLDVWEEIGIGRQLARQGITWRTARTFLGERELFAMQLPDDGSSRFPPFVNLPQSATEAALADAVAAEGRIERRLVAATEVSSQGERAVVAGRDADGDGVELSAPWAVLATGAHSGELRRQLGVDFPGHSYDDLFLICDVRIPEAAHRGWERERRFYFDPPWNPGRQVLIHPQPEGVLRIDWQVDRSFDLELERRTGALDRRIRRILEDLDYELVWSSVYRFHGRCASRLRAGRFLLAGDCAHLMAPFGARGLNSGVHDAENLAWKLALVLRGEAPETLIDSYDAERRAAALENLRVTERTMRFLVPHSAAERRHRERTLEAARSDPAHRAEVDSGRLYQPFAYRDSPLTTPELGDPPGRLQAGDLLPDLVLEDGRALRSIARQGWLVVVHGDLPLDIEALAAACGARLRVLRVEARSGATEGSTVETGLSASEVLCPALGLGQGDALVARPDAHVAGFVRCRAGAADGRALPELLVPIVRRGLGHPVG